MYAAPPVLTNRLLSALSDQVRAKIVERLAPVTLAAGEQIEAPGSPVEHVYFVTAGVISMVAASRNKRSLQIGMIGREGMIGSSIALGDEIASNASFVQFSGHAFRMDAEEFRTAVSSDPELRNIVLKYFRVLWSQASSAALSNADQGVVPRLARWLLMMLDRVDGDTLEITHDHMAQALLVRRPGITEALHLLEGEHLVASRRNVLELVDRPGLVARAGHSYGASEAEYRRLIDGRLA